MVKPLFTAGRLNRRVTIVRPTFTTNAHNERVESSPARTKAWCSMQAGPGTERFQSAEVAGSAPMRFLFRWQPDLIRDTDRIEGDDGRTYEVLWWGELDLRVGIEVLGQARSETTA